MINFKHHLMLDHANRSDFDMRSEDQKKAIFGPRSQGAGSTINFINPTRCAIVKREFTWDRRQKERRFQRVVHSGSPQGRACRLCPCQGVYCPAPLRLRNMGVDKGHTRQAVQGDGSPECVSASADTRKPPFKRKGTLCRLYA